MHLIPAVSHERLLLMLLVEGFPALWCLIASCLSTSLTSSVIFLWLNWLVKGNILTYRLASNASICRFQPMIELLSQTERRRRFLCILARILSYNGTTGRRIAYITNTVAAILAVTITAYVSAVTWLHLAALMGHLNLNWLNNWMKHLNSITHCLNALRGFNSLLFFV